VEKIIEQLDARFREWQPELADEMRRQIADLIALADHEGLDAVRLRREAWQAHALGWSETVATWTGSTDTLRFEATRDELLPPDERPLG